MFDSFRVAWLRVGRWPRLLAAATCLLLAALSALGAAHDRAAARAPARTVPVVVTTHAVAAGRATVPLAHTFRLEEIVDAHRTMEAGTAAGKLVVTTT